MKLGGRDASRFLAKPDPAAAAILLYGPDAMRVALKRAALIETLIGPDGAGEMRLTRLPGGDLRRDPAALQDATRASGFFPGPRAVLVEDATEAIAPALKSALADWRPGDARMVATAGNLTPGNALRKLAETAPNAAAIAVYADPPGRDEIEAALKTAGLALPDRAALAVIEGLAQSLDPGDFAQFVGKLALYKRGDPAPLSPDDVAAVAPPAPESEVEAVVALAADGDAARLATAFRNLGPGSPTSLTIAAGRYFRTLHAAAAAPDGPDAALARARPPVFGPRRTRMATQARSLGPDRLERALGLIMEAELTLRSSRPVPALAVAERLFLRLAMLGRGG